MDATLLFKVLPGLVIAMENFFPGAGQGAAKLAAIKALLSAFMPADQMARIEGIVAMIVNVANMLGAFKAQGAGVAGVLGGLAGFGMPGVVHPIDVGAPNLGQPAAAVRPITEA